MKHSKQISRQNLFEITSSGTNNSLVICHGHFNVIHPGHLRFLKFAKSLGDKLLVLVLEDKELMPSQAATYHSENDRLLGVAELEAIDYVHIMREPVENILQDLKPKTLALGKEFEITRRSIVEQQITIVEQNAGSVVFHSGHLYDADTIDTLDWNKFSSQSHSVFLKSCAAQNIKISDLINRYNSNPDPNFLVIGDTILDRYLGCEAIGMSSEAPVLVVNEVDKEDYLGGAAIVASHLKAMGAECSYISVVGDDPEGEIVTLMLGNNKVSSTLIKDNERPTTLKSRYVVGTQKVFRASRLSERNVSKQLENKLIERIEEMLPEHDAILVSDFTYGVLTRNVIEKIQQLAEKLGKPMFGDLQCSSQIGDLGKLKNYHLLCPTEKEARIAMHNYDDGLETIARRLLKKSNCRTLVLTLGERGMISYENSGTDTPSSQYFPSRVAYPLDVTGAGDALLSAVSIGICKGFSIMESSILGAGAASLAVMQRGNKPIKKADLMNFLNTLTNQQ